MPFLLAFAGYSLMYGGALLSIFRVVPGLMIYVGGLWVYGFGLSYSGLPAQSWQFSVQASVAAVGFTAISYGWDAWIRFRHGDKPYQPLNILLVGGSVALTLGTLIGPAWGLGVLFIFVLPLFVQIMKKYSLGSLLVLIGPGLIRLLGLMAIIIWALVFPLVI